MGDHRCFRACCSNMSTRFIHLNLYLEWPLSYLININSFLFDIVGDVFCVRNRSKHNHGVAGRTWHVFKWKAHTRHSKSIPNDTLAVIPVTAEHIAEATAEPTPAKLAYTEAQTVIQAADPILKHIKRHNWPGPNPFNYLEINYSMLN